MKIKTLNINNIKSFKGLHEISFSDNINILVGRNNAGKSAILKSILCLQNADMNAQDVTIGETKAEIRLNFDEFNVYNTQNFQYSLLSEYKFTYQGNGVTYSFQTASNEPLNIIYPYLSKRKVLAFSDSINETAAASVTGNFQHLYAKIDRLINPFHPNHSQYVEFSEAILGFVVSTTNRGDGKHAVLFIDTFKDIELSQMGEGVANILALITDLCVAKNKIFIIEEPENDIHPLALKALLKLIAEKSHENQFFISTHSNIVMKHLGAVDDVKVFKVVRDKQDEIYNLMYLSTVHEVPATPSARREVLEELGYDLWEYDLWKAWLFFEESSAEEIVRDYLIPWFFPELGSKVRTYAANNFQSIEPRLDDFNKLFVFLHLEPVYKNRVWVVIDADGIDKGESELINKLRNTYKAHGWNVSNFVQLSNHDFETYYPKEFEKEMDDIFAIKAKRTRKEEKAKLLVRVKEWIKQDEQYAKAAFEASAAEIISILSQISSAL